MHGHDLDNQQGAALLTTIIVLVLLTIIGVAGINTTSTDLEISSNYRDANQQFYQADGHLNLVFQDTSTWLNATSPLTDSPTPKYSDGRDFDGDGKNEFVTTVTGLTENSTDDLPDVGFNSENTIIGKGISIKSDKNKNGSNINNYVIIANHTESSTQIEAGRIVVGAPKQ